MGLRKEKAARLKVHILEQTLKLTGRKPFEDLYVEDLCAKVKISKVTFFKYFPQKEDLLMYFLRVWCLQRAAEFATKPKEGLQGIYYLADKIGESCEQHPGIMLSLVGYLSDSRRVLKPFPLKAEEKQLLLPSVPGVQQMEILSLDQMLEKFTLESIFRKEITRSTATKDISNLFMATLLGSIITGHINQITPVRFYFKKNIDLLLKGLQ
ncbi:MAG: TetR/AcrR family transcriptional regulator [Cyclobacteriaceae bacterium]|jgi:AcrR family transcriptional regulator|nr:TetR/AcrR family transcriptional regulator [Cyclobacteriaceae bacterium]